MPGLRRPFRGGRSGGILVGMPRHLSVIARRGGAAGVLAAMLAAPLVAQAPQPLAPDLQIRLAVQAAPPSLRDSATVQGYDAQGAFVTLRRGTNRLVCMAPDPKAEHLEVSCHDRDLEPFFARGRALAAQGVTGERRVRQRWAEITAHRLSMPTGKMNTIMTGTGFDSTTGQIHDAYTRWVIYVPNATVASTGLGEAPTAPGAPWLMFAGTPGAHIMITPPRPTPPPAAAPTHQ